MKKLLITLMLISPTSFADWGDVYYCEETSSSTTLANGMQGVTVPEKFKFSLDKTKKAMVFKSNGFWNDIVIALRPDNLLPSEENWLFGTGQSMGAFRKGKFVYAHLTFHGINTRTADCDKF